MMFRIGRKSNPNWDEIHQLLKQGAARQDRIERQLEQMAARQDRTDQQLEQLAQEQTRLAKEQEERERARVAEEKQRERARVAQEERRKRDEAARNKERAQQEAAWEAQRQKDRAENQLMDKQLREMIGGAAYDLSNVGDAYFMLAWNDGKQVLIGDVEFDEVLDNEKYQAHGKEMECDLVLLNSTYIGIVEVKPTLHPKDVAAFDAKLRDVLPFVLPAQYRHLQVMPVIGGERIMEGVRERIEAHGFALLRRYGIKAKLEIEHLRPRPPVGKLPPRA